MSDYSIVPNAALTATADAIRTKSGSQDTIEFDHNTGFKDAVDAIPSGGGVSLNDYIISSTLYSTFTTYIDYNVSNLRAYLFHGCAYVTCWVFPNLSEEVGISSFRLNNHLASVDIGEPQLIRGASFNGCSVLSILVIRGTTMTTLDNTTAFTNTPFASGGPGGTLYVPSALVSQYTQATNWSTILGYANNQIKSIESTHTDPNAPIDLTLYYADGTPIPTT